MATLSADATTTIVEILAASNSHGTEAGKEDMAGKAIGTRGRALAPKGHQPIVHMGIDPNRVGTVVDHHKSID